MDFSKYSQGFANPFILSIIIVIVINIMVYFFFCPKVTTKTYFRSIFYMTIVITAMVYMHHREVDKYYSEELKKNINIDLVKGTGPTNDKIEPIITNTVATEDELIL